MKKILLLSVWAFSLIAAIWAQPAPTAVSVAASAVKKLSPEEVIAEREKYSKEVLDSIQGRTKEPAETVFKNIKSLKGVPAGRVVAIMNLGYSQSLGVSCTHCHVAGEWDKEDKPQLQITREMSLMAATINKELLPKIANLDSKQPIVNCTTCHRGQVKPATDLAKK